MLTNYVRKTQWLRKGILILFLPLVFTLSSLMTIHTAPTAKAEGLLDGVTCLLRGVVKQQCPASTQAPAQQSPQPTPAPSPAPSQTPAQSSQAPAQTPPVAPASEDPVVLDEIALPEKTDTPDTINRAIRGNQSKTLANALPNLGVGEAILGQAETVAPIEATGQGWVIYSVPWYWWLLMIALITTIGVLIANMIRRGKARR